MCNHRHGAGCAATILLLSLLLAGPSRTPGLTGQPAPNIIGFGYTATTAWGHPTKEGEDDGGDGGDNDGENGDAGLAGSWAAQEQETAQQETSLRGENRRQGRTGNSSSTTIDSQQQQQQQQQLMDAIMQGGGSPEAFLRFWNQREADAPPRAPSAPAPPSIGTPSHSRTLPHSPATVDGSGRLSPDTVSIVGSADWSDAASLAEVAQRAAEQAAVEAAEMMQEHLNVGGRVTATD